MLIKPGHPVVVPDHEPNELLIIETPNLSEDATPTIEAVISKNGRDIEILADGEIIVILTEFTDIDALQLECVVTNSMSNATSPETYQPTHDQRLEVIDAGQTLITISDFDLAADRLEVCARVDTRLDLMQETDGTLVFVDNEPVFALPGIAPEALLSKMIVRH